MVPGGSRLEMLVLSHPNDRDKDVVGWGTLGRGGFGLWKQETGLARGPVVTDNRLSVQ